MRLVQKIAAAALGYCQALHREFVKALAEDAERIPDPLTVLRQHQPAAEPGCCPLFACPHCGETLICHTAALEWAPPTTSADN